LIYEELKELYKFLIFMRLRQVLSAGLFINLF
jgi:hypothetical protein